jgi:hypothetical protein
MGVNCYYLDTISYKMDTLCYDIVAFFYQFETFNKYIA